MAWTVRALYSVSRMSGVTSSFVLNLPMGSDSSKMQSIVLKTDRAKQSFSKGFFKSLDSESIS